MVAFNGGDAEIGVKSNGEDHDKPLDLGLWDALGFSMFRQTCKVRYAPEYGQRIYALVT